MITELLKIIRESIRAVPAMRYALAVAGLLAVVGMVEAFKISPQMAVFGAIITLVLMVAMVIFARLTTTASRHFFIPATIMMWAFLIVTVASAFLLFTSAFFQWPRGLRELTGPPVAVSSVGETEDVDPLVSAARLQRTNQDYTGAWNTIRRATAAAPRSKAALDEQTRTAMDWIRNMHVTAPATFTSTVMPLSEHLHLALATATGSFAADIRAHIGHANFLRHRDGARGLKIEEEYSASVALDPKNPFAHAMWGHWLAFQREPIERVKDRFRLALSSGREREYVQHVRLAALDWLGTQEAAIEAVTAADEIRRSGEPLSPGARRIIVTRAYPRTGRDREEQLLDALPPADHLATFRWLLEGREPGSSPNEAYYLARLTEATGDFRAAAELYRPLLALNTSFAERIRAGFKRCEAELGK